MGKPLLTESRDTFGFRTHLAGHTLKNIGLIGGMSWESTALYYEIINREVARQRGGLRSAPMRIASLDFHEIAERQKAGDWAGMAQILGDAAQQLQASGADCILIGTNTMHKIAPQVQARIDVPLLHIADITAQAIVAAGLTRVGLTGTRFTMEEAFYKVRLAEYGIECVIPTPAERDDIHRTIFSELCQGVIDAGSKARFVQCLAALQQRGAQGVILGCTELPLLVDQRDTALPLFDTTRLHAMAAVRFALH
jgi:aspartate racemase